MTMISEEEKGEVQGESIAGSGQQSKGWGMWGVYKRGRPRRAMAIAGRRM